MRTPIIAVPAPTYRAISSEIGRLGLEVIAQPRGAVLLTHRNPATVKNAIRVMSRMNITYVVR